MKNRRWLWMLPLIFAVASCQQKMGSQNFLQENSEAKSKTNILFVISDDQSFPHTSAYGYKAVQTPAFDRIAKEGILFTKAISASPGCSPSRAALLTGRNCWQIEEAGTHASGFSRDYATYPDLLESAGYFVGYTGKGWGPGNWKISGRERNPAGYEFNSLKLKSPQYISNTDYAANFADFLSKIGTDQPFCFWFGAHEPHRPFSPGIGLAHGKKLSDVVVPAFLPDTPEIRSDILDYCFEIEWFDQHLGRIFQLLEAAGELDNTIIVVTSDNGMAFPRAKANTYEYGIHVPLAIRWGNRIRPGQVSDQVISLIDVAPTFLEVAGVRHPSESTGAFPMAGASMVPVFSERALSATSKPRAGVYSSRERHSSSRPENWSYPQRALRTEDYLYIRNFKPERWPAGDPQKIEKDSATQKESLGPMHGGYHDIDACPTLDLLIEKRDQRHISRYFHLAVDKRPAEELYDIRKDPGCLHNLANSPKADKTKTALKSTLDTYLQETKDPRVLGSGDIFETYQRYQGVFRSFPAAPVLNQ